MKIKILALLGALAFAAPVVAEAAPAGALTAQEYSSAVTAPATFDTALAPGDSTAKVENVWWRRGWGWRGGWGYRRFGYGYGWRRPYWRRRFFY